MLTVFSIPKAFEGRIGVIQRNALRSWAALGSGVQVVLVGNERGVAEAALNARVKHVAVVKASEQGTPRIDDTFRRVDEVAEHSLRCFVNADVLLLDDFLPAVERVREVFDQFLVIGETRDLEIKEELSVEDASQREALLEHARAEGKTRGPTAIDYFVFTAGIFDPVPAFVVGRPRFDNWLVWRARTRGPVVDATRALVAVHQRHDYAHVTGGFQEAHFGSEAIRNEQLAGGSDRIYTILDASHRLRSDGSIGRHAGSVLRIRETARKVAWKLAERGR